MLHFSTNANILKVKTVAVRKLCGKLLIIESILPKLYSEF